MESVLRMNELALLGGTPVLDKCLEPYNSLGLDEEKAVVEVVKSGCLSGFYGSWRDGFLGGPKVQEFENAWKHYFCVENVISVNSATSGLYAAMGAIGLSPGDEVIVPPTTMSATAMAPLIYGGIPVFADIDEDTFCLGLESVRQNITEKTKAIIVVNLFGQAGPLKELRELCDTKNIYLIEDNAQAPLAKEYDVFCGTIGHIGVFSLNYHKHIHTGEGGMCCTNDDNLARRLRFIRNHAEAVVESADEKDLTNMVGFNYRMTELSAAIGLVQLGAIELHVKRRQHLAQQLSSAITDLDGLTAPFVRDNCEHAYYDWIIRYDAAQVGVSRKLFVDALNAEGFPCFEGYVKPLYQLPIFSNNVAIGNKGYPFSLSQRSYHKGLCPVAERLYEEEIIGFETCAYDINSGDLGLLSTALNKVFSNRFALINKEK